MAFPSERDPHEKMVLTEDERALIQQFDFAIRNCVGTIVGAVEQFVMGMEARNQARLKMANDGFNEWEPRLPKRIRMIEAALPQLEHHANPLMREFFPLFSASLKIFKEMEVSIKTIHGLRSVENGDRVRAAEVLLQRLPLLPPLIAEAQKRLAEKSRQRPPEMEQQSRMEKMLLDGIARDTQQTMMTLPRRQGEVGRNITSSLPFLSAAGLELQVRELEVQPISAAIAENPLYPAYRRGASELDRMTARELDK